MAGPAQVEIDLMAPLDPNKSPKPHVPALNHIGSGPTHTHTHTNTHTTHDTRRNTRHDTTRHETPRKSHTETHLP